MTIDNDLARNFGFDITMSEGSMGLPSAVHKEYMERCQFLYKEFITNMGVHMKTEKALRKELRALHKEKIQHLRFSLYRSTNDPFARQGAQSASSMPFGSRNNTPYGLNTVVGEDSVFRPQTAPTGSHRPLEIIAERPKTACVDAHHDVNDQDDQSESGLSDMSDVSKSTVAGVVDRKTEQSSERKITVGKATFNKITHGKVRAKLKHRDGRFLVQPVRTDFESDVSNQDTHAFEPAITKQKFDPVHERLALVRKITDFKSPTISSDMKINNRVPIQKSLKGIDAKRTTVSEIYKNARDRKTRHFRIVTIMPRSKSAMGAKNTTDINVDVRSRSSFPDRDLNSQLSHMYDGSRDGTPLFMRQMLNSQKDEIDSVASVNQTRPRSILQSSSSATKSLNESFSAKEASNIISPGIARPLSKVAFARSDSQTSGHMLLQPNAGGLDLSASFASSIEGGKQSGGKLNVSASSGNRPRSVSVNSDTTAISLQGDHPVSSDSRGVSVLNNSLRGRHGLSPADLKSRGLHRTESKQSLSSTGTSTSFMTKLKMATETKGKKLGTGSVQKLGFQAPVKMESRKDTVDIVRQQLRKDKQLDETMTVWRRRMAIKSSLMSHSSFSVKLKVK